MRILQIVPSLEQEASGPSYSVPQLANALADRGHDVRLLSVGGQAPSVDVRCQQTRFANDWSSPRVLKHLWASREMKAALPALAAEADIVHAHGLWAMPNVYPARAAKRAGRPYVISPRGTLGPAALRFSAMRKRLFWLALQGGAVRSARAFHATSESEHGEIRDFGLGQPVILAPNGIELPSLSPRPAPPARTALYVGRVHPKKGLENLIAAWARAAPSHTGWSLRIVGPGDERYLDQLRRLAAQSGAPHIAFEGGVYGQDKQHAYRDADLFVMPTLNENFGMTVAEALAHATPVVCTKGAPWAGLTAHGAGWWIDHGVEPLTAALDKAMTLDRDALAEMGLAGRRWMADEFSWPAVAARMEAAYQWILDGGSPPPSVRLD